LTSGGNDSGALPILDRHGDEVEKDDDCCWKAGRRNAGIDVSVERGLLSALTQRRLAGVNMVCDVDEVWIATTATIFRWRNKCAANFPPLTSEAWHRLAPPSPRFPLIHRPPPSGIVDITIASLLGLFINCLLRQVGHQRLSLSTFIPPTPFHSTPQHPSMPPGPHDLRPTTSHS
jgi:hypothetical protein